MIPSNRPLNKSTSLKEALSLIDRMRQKNIRSAEYQQSLSKVTHLDSVRNIKRRKEYLEIISHANILNMGVTKKILRIIYSIDFLSYQKLEVHTFSLKKLWVIVCISQISQALRYKTETFSFLTLFSRSKNAEAAFSSLEENVLLLAYEKNIIRMLSFLCRDMFLYWQIHLYSKFFSEKLDIYTRNLYLNKLKVWMNSDIFKTSYKYNEVEKYLWRPDDFLNLRKDLNNSLFRKSMEFLQNQFSFKWKTSGDREKVKMSNIVSYQPLSKIFGRVSQSYSFLMMLNMNQKDFLYPQRYRSSYLRYFVSEIFCDIVAQFKILNVTEPWILHTVQISKYCASQVYSFLNDPSKSTLLFKSTVNPNSPYVINSPFQFLSRGKSKHPSFPKDILEAGHKIQQMIEFTAMQRVLLESLPEKITDLVRTETPSCTDKHFIHTLETPSTYEKQRISYLSFYDHISHLQKTHVYAMEYMYGISKSLKYTIAQDHLRLVLSVAKSPKYRTLDMADLLQEGMLGLTKAVERFQLDRGYQFTTYATWWVHQALNRVTLTSNHIIPLPTHVQRKVHLILAASTHLTNKLNREPYVEEIAKELRLPVQKIYQFIQTSALSRRFLSLDQTIRAGDPRTYLTMLQTSSIKTPVDLTPLFLYFSTLLSPRESAILRLRLGLYPFKRHTLDQLAKIFSVPRERIKVVEKSSFEKIRNAVLHLPTYPSIFDLVGKSLTS